ncbi:MAG: hypothetical protein OXC92_08990 [Flavobacteriaceae bacterium]|nr:hypothetical protein [Flavobacteriaceae bacterium]
MPFPTDAKWSQEVLDNGHKRAQKEKVIQRQTDAKASQELVRPTFHGKDPRRAPKAHLQTQDLSGETGPRTPTERRSATKRPIPKRAGLRPTHHQSKTNRSKQGVCHSRLAWPKARPIKKMHSERRRARWPLGAKP